MTFVTISTICNNIAKSINTNKLLHNISVRCIVKKVSQYPYIVYMDIVDATNPNQVLTATINVNVYNNDLKSNDIVIITGNISFSKSINFRVSKYYIDKPQLSQYELIVQKLKKFKILDIEKKNIPHTIKRIAIISSTNAAGLKDCLDIISGIKLQKIYIYPSAMQGPFMEESILKSIEQIKQDRIELKIDVILLIRGGGAKTDLEWFDNFNLAKCIKQCKIPVICGIGHEIDHTIMDIVCDKSCNTPTQVAYYLNDIVNNCMRNNKMLNIMYHNKINKLLSYVNQFDTLIERQNQLLYKESENTILKLLQMYEKKCNIMKNYYINIERTIIDGNIWYEKLLSNVEKYSNITNNKINEIKLEINNYVDKFTNIQIRNKTTGKNILSKKEYNLAVKRKQKLYIKFIDGTIVL